MTRSTRRPAHEDHHSRRRHRRLTGFEGAGRELPDRLLDRHPPIADQDQLLVVEDRHDQDRTGMTHDAAIHRLSGGGLESALLDIEDPTPIDVISLNGSTHGYHG